MKALKTKVWLILESYHNFYRLFLVVVEKIMAIIVSVEGVIDRVAGAVA